MSSPPPQNPYGSPPPGGGPSWGGPPPQNPGGPPPGFGPPQGPPGGPPPWGSQPPQWSGPPGPPPGGGGRGKWILGGLAVVLAIALAVVITVLVIRPDSGGDGSSTPTSGASEFASAGDDGPVNIITEDPTCAAWGRISREYVDKTKSVNWGERDFAVPESAWTPELRTMYETVSVAMGRAADQAEQLRRQTPHRVMRELYEQFIAYARSFMKRVPSYEAKDDNFAVVTDTITTAAADICSAIAYRSAPSIAPLVANPQIPKTRSVPPAPDLPPTLLAAPNPICTNWEVSAQKFSDETAEWRALDRQTAAADWTPDERKLNDSAASAMTSNAAVVERLGRQSDNATLEDFATLAGQYLLGFAASVPDYAAADSFLYDGAAQLVRTVNWACRAAT